MIWLSISPPSLNQRASTLQKRTHGIVFKVNNCNTSPHFLRLTIGGSYPGALSAWFRYKYPHLTVGALASSAVINAILDFTAYDE